MGSPIRDDDLNVSAREWRAVREGETHAATKTTRNKTPESFIVGVGASGALLAGAAIVFVTLVGLVSFNVWPSGPEASGIDGNVELSAATPAGSSGGGAAIPASAASGQLSSTTAGAGTGAGGGKGGGGNGRGSGDVKGGQPKAGLDHPTTTTSAPPSTGTGDSGPVTSPPGTASKDPTHPVHPSHPEAPHQNISTGTNGKEDPNGNDSADVVTGKGPLRKPFSESHSDSSNSGPPNGHGWAKAKHE
jgi:hypothetical protein